MSQEHPLVTEFLNYLRYERHFSPHTGKCYAADLHQFSQFLIGGPEAAINAAAPIARGTSNMTLRSHAMGGSGSTAVATMTATDVETIKQKLLASDANQIRAFLSFLTEREYSKATAARKLATLRSFYKFCLRRGYIQTNPVATIRTQAETRPEFSISTRSRSSSAPRMTPRFSALATARCSRACTPPACASAARRPQRQRSRSRQRPSPRSRQGSQGTHHPHRPDGHCRHRPIPRDAKQRSAQYDLQSGSHVRQQARPAPQHPKRPPQAR
ncbi:MAG: site-specific integrase [Planctomycetes bacterium]|nr:site-specific integrase [Planctomycetota bacterium]